MFENNLNLTIKIQYWFITHRVLFRRLGVLLLMIFDILIIWLGATGWIKYAGTRDEYERIIQELSQQTLVTDSGKARVAPLIIEKIAAIPNGQNKYDLVALVKNPNTKWFVENIDYQFIADGVVIDSGSAFILSGEEKVITKLGLTLTQRPRSISLSFKNDDISWMRIKGDTLFGARLPVFKSSNIVFTPVVSQQLAPFSRLSFELANESIDSFWRVDVHALIFDAGGNIVGVGYAPWDNAFEGTRHQFFISWSTIISQGNKVSIHPDINITDPSVIKK